VFFMNRTWMGLARTIAMNMILGFLVFFVFSAVGGGGGPQAAAPPHLL
jgi:hypothetical protein